MSSLTNGAGNAPVVLTMLRDLVSTSLAERVAAELLYTCINIVVAETFENAAVDRLRTFLEAVCCERTV